MFRRLFLITALAVAAASAAVAQPSSHRVSDAWVRTPPPGARVAAGYLTITNAGPTADRLLGVSSPAAERVEVHEMSMAGGVMRMRQVDGLNVPAGGRVVLTPGGLHLMLMGPRRALTAGAGVPVTLRFQRAGAVTVSALVRAATR